MLLWLKPPLANDFCNFLNKIAKIMKIFVEVDLLKAISPSANAKRSDQLFLSYLTGYKVAQKTALAKGGSSHSNTRYIIELS